MICLIFQQVVLAIAEQAYVPEYLRRQFEVEKTVDKARLYITAKGLYEVSINGKKVGEDFMTPGFTKYDSTIETLTYDVTKNINSGANVIGAILAECYPWNEMWFMVRPAGVM